MGSSIYKRRDGYVCEWEEKRDVVIDCVKIKKSNGVKAQAR